MTRRRARVPWTRRWHSSRPRSNHWKAAMVIVDAPGPSRLSRIQPANLVIMAHGLSSFCTGLAFPYTAIHLASKLGTGGVALFFSSTAVASLVVAAALAAGYLRLSRLSLCLLGNALWFIGYLAMPFVGSSTA